MVEAQGCADWRSKDDEDEWKLLYTGSSSPRSKVESSGNNIKRQVPLQRTEAGCRSLDKVLGSTSGQEKDRKTRSACQDKETGEYIVSLERPQGK
jgi:hypothetical protein